MFPSTRVQLSDVVARCGRKARCPRASASAAIPRFAVVHVSALIQEAARRPAGPKLLPLRLHREVCRLARDTGVMTCDPLRFRLPLVRLVLDPAATARSGRPLHPPSPARCWRDVISSADVCAVLERGLALPVLVRARRSAPPACPAVLRPGASNGLDHRGRSPPSTPIERSAFSSRVRSARGVIQPPARPWIAVCHGLRSIPFEASCSLPLVPPVPAGQRSASIFACVRPFVGQLVRPAAAQRRPLSPPPRPRPSLEQPWPPRARMFVAAPRDSAALSRPSPQVRQARPRASPCQSVTYSRLCFALSASSLRRRRVSPLCSALSSEQRGRFILGGGQRPARLGGCSSRPHGLFRLFRRARRRSSSPNSSAAASHGGGAEVRQISPVLFVGKLDDLKRVLFPPRRGPPWPCCQLRLKRRPAATSVATRPPP